MKPAPYLLDRYGPWLLLPLVLILVYRLRFSRTGLSEKENQDDAGRVETILEILSEVPALVRKKI